MAQYTLELPSFVPLSIALSSYLMKSTTQFPIREIPDLGWKDVIELLK
jgi:hypothetical protein